jgi:hypothetical protein
MIANLVEQGHSEHCAARLVHGDGFCVCPADGTGSPYHTMNPPPGGWKFLPVEVPLTQGQALRKLRLAYGNLSLGEAAQFLGISVVQYSALERDNVVFKKD